MRGEILMQAIHKNNTVIQKSIGGQPPGKGPIKWLGEAIRHPEFVMAMLSGVFILAAWGLSFWSQWLSITMYIVAYVIGGFIKTKEGLIHLWEERDIDVNLLMIFAAMGAATIGYWNEGAALIFIFALSGALESLASERSHKDISALVSMRPEQAWKMTENGLSQVSVQDLIIGDVVVIKPGEVIPVDGKVQTGRSSVNQAAITGESLPLDKASGDEVYAGSLNGEGALYVTVTSLASDTLFSKIITLVEQAEQQVPVSQRWIKRLEGMYAKAVIVVTVLLILIPPLWMAWSWQAAFYKAMVFMVVASPCAIVSSVMPAILSAMSRSARNGVLFKSGACMDLLSEVNVVAFDKTGTLTKGAPIVTEFYTEAGYDKVEVLKACAAAESLSEHPLARAIVSYAVEQGVELQEVEEIEQLTALAGQGVEARIAGKVWRITKANEKDVEMPEQMCQNIRHLSQAGNTISVIQCDGEYVGLFAMQDTLRPQAKAMIAKLHDLGVTTVMLTGDRELTAAAIAREAGIDHVYADLLPEDKVNHVSQLRETCGGVIMVGDGVNDAPALATATVGIAMGAAGSGAALDVADVVLMNDSLEHMVHTITLARRTKKIIKQNLTFAAMVISLLVASNFIQGLPLPLGVVGHEGSTILVILNGLRLLR